MLPVAFVSCKEEVEFYFFEFPFCGHLCSSSNLHDLRFSVLPSSVVRNIFPLIYWYCFIFTFLCFRGCFVVTRCKLYGFSPQFIKSYKFSVS